MNYLQTMRILKKVKKSLLASVFFILTTHSFAAIDDTEIIGESSGNFQYFSLNGADEIIVRHGAAIDALGIISNGTVETSGGNGGSQEQISYQNLNEIVVYSGNYRWGGGGTRIIRLDFNYIDGSSISTGSTSYSNNVRSMNIPITGQLSGITAWSSGWLLDGVQFHISTGTDSDTTISSEHPISQENFSKLDIKVAHHHEGNFLYSVLTLRNSNKYIGLPSYDGSNVIDLAYLVAGQNIRDEIDFDRLKIIVCMPEELFIEQEGYVLNSNLCTNGIYDRFAKNLEAKWFRGKWFRWDERGSRVYALNVYYSRSLNGDVQCLSYDGRDCAWLSDASSDTHIISDNSTLRGLENDADALKEYLDMYDGGLHLITSNGNWTRNISLPSSDVFNGTVVTVEVNSDWYVNLHFNNAKLVRVNPGETYSLTYLNGYWINSLSDINLDYNTVLSANPLVCGAQHKAIWGVTGYDNPNHWCSRLRSANQTLYAQNVEQMRIAKERHMDLLFDKMESDKLNKIGTEYVDRIHYLEAQLTFKETQTFSICTLGSGLFIATFGLGWGICSSYLAQYEDLTDEYNALLNERDAKLDSARALVNEGRAQQYHELHQQWAGDSSDFSALLKEESASIDELKQIKEHYDKTAEEKYQEYLAAIQKYTYDQDPENILLTGLENKPLIGPLIEQEVQNIVAYEQNPSGKNLRRLILGTAGMFGQTVEAGIEFATEDDGMNSDTLQFLEDVLTDLDDDHSVGEALEDIVSDLINDLGDEAVESIRHAGLWVDNPIDDPALQLNYEGVVDLRAQAVRYDYDPWLDTSELARLFQAKFSYNYSDDSSAASPGSGSSQARQVETTSHGEIDRSAFQNRLTAIFMHSFGKDYAEVVKRNPDNRNLTHEQINHRLLEVVSSAVYSEQRTPHWVHSDVIGHRPAGLLYDNDHAVILLNADFLDPLEEDLSKFYFEELGHMINWWRCKAFEVDVSHCSSNGDGGARFRDAVLLDPSLHEASYESLLSQLPPHLEVDKVAVTFNDDNKLGILEGWPHYYTMNDHISSLGKFSWLMRLGLDIGTEYPQVSDEFDIEVSITAPQLAKKGDPWTKVENCQAPYNVDDVLNPTYTPSNKMCMCENDAQTDCNMPTMWVSISFRDAIKLSITNMPALTENENEVVAGTANSGIADVSPRLVRKHGGKLPFQLQSVHSTKWDYYGDNNIYFKKFTAALALKADLWKLGHLLKDELKGTDTSFNGHKPELSLKTAPAQGSYLVEIATKDTQDFYAWLGTDIQSAVTGCVVGVAISVLSEEELDPVLLCHGISDTAEALESAFQGLDKRPTMLFEADGNLTVPLSLEYKYAKAKAAKANASNEIELSEFSGSRVGYGQRGANVNIEPESYPTQGVGYDESTGVISMNPAEALPEGAPSGLPNPQISSVKQKMHSKLKNGLKKLGNSISPIAVFRFRIGFKYSETLLQAGEYNLPSAIVSD